MGIFKWVDVSWNKADQNSNLSLLNSVFVYFSLTNREYVERENESEKGFYYRWRSVSLFINSLTKDAYQRARFLSAGMCPLGRGFLYPSSPRELSLLPSVNVRSYMVVYKQTMAC